MIILSVGLSRVALGVHSLNQVLYGWSYGLWLAFFLFHYARPPLQIHIKRLLTYQSSLVQYIPYYFHLALIIWASIAVMSLLNFLVAKRDFPGPP